jgi:hypothetical protein
MPTPFACLLGVLYLGEGIRVAGFDWFCSDTTSGMVQGWWSNFGVMTEGEPVKGRHVWITKAFWGWESEERCPRGLGPSSLHR